MHDLLALVAKELTSAKVDFALVGGHAVSARTEPRFTRDLDLAVAVADDAEAERLVAGLAQRGFRIVALIEQEATGRLATVRLEHLSCPGVIVDLLFATAGIEPEVVRGATVLELTESLQMPVASIGHLLALKTLSLDDRRRPQDRMDVVALLAQAGDADLQTAASMLQLIAARGYARGRDLVDLFRELRSDS